MTVRKATGFTVEVDDGTGVLAEMARPVAEAGINLLALYGGPAGEGKAKICCVPENADSLRSLAAEGGITVEEIDVLLVDGDDRPGVSAELAQKLATAGINIVGILGATTGGRFAIAVVVASEDVDRAAAALGG